MPLKICTIGCGSHSALVHGPSYQKYVKHYPDTILVACCDIDQEKAVAYKENFGFKACYTDMFQMLEKERPDAVCVIVPEQVICETVIDVCELGYHVQLEKPPGLCEEETLRMIAAAERSDVINQVAFNRRHMPLVKALKKEMNRYVSNTIQSICYDFFRYDRRDAAFETTAIHGIDVVKNIMGSDFKEVRFTYQDMPQLGENVVNIFMECTFVNGVVGRLNFCPCTGIVVERICVHATDHTFFLKTPIWNEFDTPGELVHVERGELNSQISGLALTCGKEMFETNGFYDENAEFFENVRTGRKGQNTISSALQAVKIAEAIKQRKAVWYL